MFYISFYFPLIIHKKLHRLLPISAIKIPIEQMVFKIIQQSICIFVCKSIPETHKCHGLQRNQWTENARNIVDFGLVMDLYIFLGMRCFLH